MIFQESATAEEKQESSDSEDSESSSSEEVSFMYSMIFIDLGILVTSFQVWFLAKLYI